MLALLRRHSQSWVVKSLLGALALSFVVGFGLLTGGAGSGQTALDGAIAARVDGVPITNMEVAREEQRLYDMYKQRLGDQLTDDIVKQLNIRFQAMNRLVNRIVLQKEANRLGFVVSDEELREHIASFEAFHGAAGSFDPQQYEYVLSQQRPRMTPGAFEEQQREALLIAKLERFVRDMVHVTDDELLRDFLVDGVQIDLDVLRFDPARFEKDVRPSDAEIEEYYRANAAEFAAPKKARLRTVRFPIGRWAPAIDVDEADLRAAYDANPARFKLEESVTARHILLKVPAGAPRPNRRRRANCSKGSRPRSATTSTSSPPRPRTRAGRHRPEGRRARRLRPRPDGQGIRGRRLYGADRRNRRPGGDAFRPPPDLRREARRRRHAGLRGRAGRTAQGTPGAKGRRQGPRRSRTDSRRAGRRRRLQGRDPGLDLDIGNEWVEQGSPAAQLKYPPELLREVFADGVTFPTGGKVIEFSGRPFLVEVLEQQGSESRPLREVRDEIRNRIKAERATTVAAEKALAALEDLKNGASVAQIARKYGVDAASTGMFNARAEELPLLGKVPEIRAAAFRLTEESPLPPSTFRVEGNYVVLHLRERVEPAPDAFAEARPTLRAEALERKRDAAWLDWLRNARSRFPIAWENPPADIAPVPDPGVPQQG